jgi:ribosome-binding protein aMBF1 (putative translation factor)
MREAKSLGDVIRPARHRLGWTQQDLADKLNTNKGYVSSIETGSRRWPLDYVEQLAELLGLDLVVMAVAAGILPERALEARTTLDTFPDGDPMRDIVAVLANAPLEHREAVLDYARFLVQS